MSIGTVTEIISHFAGYLHIFEAASRERLAYNEYLTGRGEEDYSPPRDGLPDSRFPPETMDTYPTPAHAFAGPDAHSAGSAYLRLQGTPPPLDVPVSEFGGIAADALARFSGAISVSVAGGGSSVIKVTYADGGNLLMIKTGQLNEMYDSDVFGADAVAVEQAYGSIDVDAVQSETLSLILDVTPQELVLEGFDSSYLVDFINERDAGRAADGAPAGNTVEPGVWVDGKLLAEGEEIPRQPENEGPEAPDGPGLWQTLGGNSMLNAGVIIDVNPAFGTFAVAGDAYQLDAIIQANAIVDADAVQFSGLPGDLISVDGNELHNIASFIRTDPGFTVPEGTELFAGYDWNVEVFEGDLVDLQALQQESWLIDNDIVLQGMGAEQSALYAGDNLIGNFADFTSLAQNYDLVIVLGDLHSANLVYQYNVLYDPDHANMVAADAVGAGNSGDPALATGGNWLSNEATIESLGSASYAPMTPQWQELIDALVNQEGTLDPSFGLGLANFNDEDFDVLVITGDFYDLNVIWQLNHLMDADTAMQLAGGAMPADLDGFTQSVNTGDNTLGNFAAIVDTGPLAGTVLGGDLYEDQILIQADLIIDDADTLQSRDNEELVSELVAFVGDTPSETVSDEAPQAATADANGDLLGNMLT